MNAQSIVRLSWPPLRTAPRISPALALRIGAMKNRFPTESRANWRERFLAIARELEAADAPRRAPLEPGPGLRKRFLPRRTLRGIRLGCARAA